MPNWCNNSITISGPTETIKQLWEDAHADMGKDTERGLLDAMAPMPQELQGTTAPSESGEDWYNWRVNNWGTKWDVSDEGLEFIDNGDGTAEISGWFDSAWAPPIEAYNTFLDDMDNCSIEASYYEPGMDFGGFYRNGDDIYFDNLQERLEQPTEEWDEQFREFEQEYDLLSEEWRFEQDEEDMLIDE
jgi:hypothetical protein